MHMLFAFACLLAVFSTASAQGLSPGLTSVVSITTNATANADYPLGTYIAFNVTFNATVNVDLSGASPNGFEIVLNTDGGAGDTAIYSSGNGTKSLIFVFIVDAEDDVNPLFFFQAGGTVNPFRFGGANVTDSFGLPTQISSATFDPTSLPATNSFLNTAIKIDATPPQIINVTFNTGTYTLDSVIPLAVTFSEAVRLNGIAHIRFLGLDFVSQGVSATDNTTINFRATVTESVPTLNLVNIAVVGLGAVFITPNVITDAAGNALITTGGDIINDVTDVIEAFSTVVVAAILRTEAAGTFVINALSGITAIVGIYSDQSNIILQVGQTINIYVEFDRLVKLTLPSGSALSTVTLTLNNGGVATLAAAVNTFSATVLFRYTVQATDRTVLAPTYLDVSGSNALNLGTGVSLFDDLTVAGTVALGTLNITTPSGTSASGAPPAGQNTTLGRNNIQVETNGDVIVSISSPNATGSENIYLEGDELWINVTFASAVTVSTTGGTPTLSLNNDRSATYSAGDSSSRSLIFVYTVTSDDSFDNELAIANRNAIKLNGGSIKDQFNNNANLTIPANIDLNLGLFAGNPDVIGRIIVEFYDSHSCGSQGLQDDEDSISQIIADNFNFTFLPYKEDSCKGSNPSDVTIEFDITDFNGNVNEFFDNQGHVIDQINNLDGVQLISLEFSDSPVLMPTLFGIALLFLTMLMRN